MKEHLTITGAKIFDAGIKSGSSGPFVNMKVRMDYSAHVREAMNWPELAGKAKLIELEEELPFGNLTMVAQQTNISGGAPAELQIEYQQCDSFRVVRVKGKKNESSRDELRFNVRTTDANAAALIFDFKRSVLKGLAELKLSWGAAVKEIKKVLVLTPPAAPSEDNGKISNAAGMAAGARKKTKHQRQLEAAAAAEAPSSSVELDPEELAAVDQVIGNSLSAEDRQLVESLH